MKANYKNKILWTSLVIIVIIGLLLSLYAVITPGIPGKDGLSIKGEKGERGEKGDSGYTPIKGKDYFDGKNGTDGKDGKNGRNGDDGRNGQDCIPNKMPTVKLNNLTKTMDRCVKYTFTLDILIDDPENDNMQISFYYKSNITKSWILLESFFGSDGIYKTNYSTYTDYSVFYWEVIVWDGSDLAIVNYNYPVEV